MTHLIAVIGAGLMGSGIAQLLAAKGQSVVIYEPFDEVRKATPARIHEICDIVGDDTACVDEITFCSDLEAALDGVDFVIEAVPEKPDLKQALFAELAQFTTDDTILCTNSSVIPVTKVAAQLSDQAAGRTVGTHFWNPPYLIPLVEVIEGERTVSATVEAAMNLMKLVGKEPVQVRKDMVVGNRLQHALWREAVSLVAEGAIDASGIDTVVTKSFGLRLPVLGPMMNADLVSIELTQDVHREVFPQLCSDSEPSSILQEMLDRGAGGMKSGEGFYSWTSESGAALHARLAQHLLEVTRK